MDIQRLVKKAKKGDKEALLELIMEQKDDYYKLAYTYTGNRDDALDAMEDMIVKLYEQIPRLKKPGSFYSWSKTILVNCCHSIHRKRKKLVFVEDWTDDAGISSQEVSPIETSVQHMHIHQLLSKLNPNQAEAIRLRYFQDLDYQSIANVTNTSLGTVKSRIFQGLNKLNQWYGGERND
ncbi:RNA polymerase sigma factor [Salinibacillus xinjiangensis]|uniref:Sigma-70 family RNA polymerase sigma factor n=1 Tax=Salinibacillus xinjiangensis TaxID=1229268 RepID=A0A6G1XA89_9BACI|nr:sigma-70 family RNA polymerase sigma factor [Salinibacillus xinjiangensis]MRG87816.1 sigma-70 family RNA polymerase sigma factor [Salinibacillus xinjiangensis]